MCWKEESFLIIERKELRHAVPLVLSARLRSSLIGSNKARVTTAILHHSSLLYETPVTSQKPTFHVRWAAALTASPLGSDRSFGMQPYRNNRLDFCRLVIQLRMVGTRTEPSRI